MNGGLCVEENESFLCRCLEGFYGHLCEGLIFLFFLVWIFLRFIYKYFKYTYNLRYIYKFFITENICDRNPCQNGGHCVPANNPLGFLCECLYPYHGHLCAGMLFFKSIITFCQVKLLYSLSIF